MRQRVKLLRFLFFNFFIGLAYLNGLSQATTCATANPVCVHNLYAHPANYTGTGPGTGPTAQAGPNYGCLTSTYNPTWMYMEITSTGTFEFYLYGVDLNEVAKSVNFVVWGPFTSLTNGCNNLTAANIVDCDNTTTILKRANLGTVTTGEYYIIMVTNYDNEYMGINYREYNVNRSNCDLSFNNRPCPHLSFRAQDFNTGVKSRFPLTVPCTLDSIHLHADFPWITGDFIMPGYLYQSPMTNARTDNLINIQDNYVTKECIGPSPCPISIGANIIYNLYVWDYSPSHLLNVEMCEAVASTANNINYTIKDVHTLNVVAGPGVWNVQDGICQTENIPPGSLTSICYFKCLNCPPGALSTTDYGRGNFYPSIAGPGTYQIQYYFDNELGCVDSITETITVTNPHNSAFTYPNDSACVNTGTLSPIITGTSTGVFSASPVGLSINPSTGVINLNASNPGTYIIKNFVGSGNCADSSTFTFTVVDSINVSITYPKNVYCTNEPNQQVTIIGPTGGTFSRTPNGLSMNLNNGTIRPSLSTPGTYTITYTVQGFCNTATAQFVVTIDSVDDASFNYPQNSYCLSDPDPTINILGSGIGTLTFTPSGLALNTNTGVIDLSNSLPGTYTIYNSFSGICGDTAQFTITIDSVLIAAFDYPKTNYCQDEPDPTINILGSVIGNLSFSPTGLALNTNTGVIDLSASTPGTYVITNSHPGNCGDTAQFTITIDSAFDASFDYPQTTYCTNNPNPTINILGSGIGNLSVTPAGLALNTNTGVIDLANSSVGTYVITNAFVGNCGDTAQFTITIDSLINASFNYANTNYCQNEPDPSILQPANIGNITVSPSTGLVINLNTGQIDLSASSIGTYTVQNIVSSNCGDDTAQFVITINPFDDASFYYQDTVVCFTIQPPYLYPTILGSGGGVFSSTPTGLFINPNSGVIDVSQSYMGTYKIYYSTGGFCGGSDSATVTIGVEDCPIPQFFSPNGSGKNDKFKIPGIEKYNASFKVFNRWGNLVYQTDHFVEWDGVMNSGWTPLSSSAPAPSGTYFYILDLKLDEIQPFMGFLQLQR